MRMQGLIDKPAKGSLVGIELAGTSIVEFPASRTVTNKCVLFTPLNHDIFFMEAQAKTIGIQKYKRMFTR